LSDVKKSSENEIGENEVLREYKKTGSRNGENKIHVTDDRDLLEQVKELRSVLRGLIKAFNFVICYDISSIPVSESGNPKLGSFGSFCNKYNEKGEVVLK